MVRFKVWHWHALAAAIGAFCCIAAGPCSSTPVQLCSDGSQAVNGVCGGAAAAPLPVSVASPPPLIPPHFAGLGFAIGRNDLAGPNPANMDSISGGPNEMYNAIAAYPAGSSYYAVAAGYAKNRSGHQVALIVRYTSSGTLDMSFNGTGYVLGPDSGYAGGNPTVITSVAIDTFGRIVVAGNGKDGDGSGNTRSFIARYNSDGSIDNTFGPNEVRTPYQFSSLYPTETGVILGPAYGWNWNSPMMTSESIQGLAINPLDNSIYVVGYSGAFAGPLVGSTYGFIAHYLSNGQLDANFGAGQGYYTGSYISSAYWGDTIAQTDATTRGNYGNAISQNEALNAISVVAGTGATPQVTIIAAGYSQSNNTGTNPSYALLMKFKQSYACNISGCFPQPGGGVDTTFNGGKRYNLSNNGVSLGGAAPSTDSYSSVALDPGNGNIFAGGKWTGFVFSGGLVSQYSSTGTLTTFNKSVNALGLAYVTSLALYPSSSATRVLAAGLTTNFASAPIFVARLQVAAGLPTDAAFHPASDVFGIPGYSWGGNYGGFGMQNSDSMGAITFSNDPIPSILGCGQSTFLSPSGPKDAILFRMSNQTMSYPSPLPNIPPGYLD